MKGADFPGSAATVPAAATNGTHRPARKSGAAKRSARSEVRTNEQAGPEPPSAPFSTREAQPIDAPMWPLHSGVWFQPELAPAPPAWSGLAIDRHNRIPAPDFLHSSAAPINCTDTLENVCGAVTPAAAPDVPRSDLAPLGWDPRADGRKEERE